MTRVTRRGRDAVDIASMQGERVGGGVRTRRRRELPGWLRRSQLRRRKAMRGCYSRDGGDFWSTMWPGGPALQHGMPLATRSWPTLSGDSFAATPTRRCTIHCALGAGWAQAMPRWLRRSMVVPPGCSRSAAFWRVPVVR
jgi:hypothetical protein